MFAKQRTTLEKLSKGKQITDPDHIIRFRDAMHPFLIRLARSKVKCRVALENTYTPLPDKPIIFAPNHSNFMDAPVSAKAIGRRSYELIGKQRIPFADWLYFALIGAIWVDRKDSEDMKASKAAIIAYLREGQSVLWFPEGTWNLSDNLLVLPMK